MKRANLWGMSVCALAGAMMFGCASAEVEPGEAGTALERRTAGEQVREHGITSYQIDRADDSTSILLEGADGRILGELLIHDPQGPMHMELSWQDHEDAFELDLRDGLSPFTIITADGVATVTMGRGGAPEGDQASLAIYDEVKPRWDVVSKVFRDLQIDGRRSEVARSQSFTTSEKGGEASAIPGEESAYPVCFPSPYCGWCDGRHNCNWLGASRKYEGCLEGAWCVSNFSWCGC